MKQDRRSFILGICAMAAAVTLLFTGSSGVSLGQLLQEPAVAAMLIFSQTGRLVWPQTDPQPPAVTEPPESAPEQSVLFTPEDAALVQINNLCGYSADVAGLLQQALTWDLTRDAPSVLILHTHACESYEKSADYQEDTPYRTRDPQYNMLSIGDRLAQLLTDAGICVIHDRTLHDYPSYDGSYIQSRATIQSYLEQYPTISLVLDLHRDAMEDSAGQQLATTVTANGHSVAQLMLVVGTNAGGMNHDNWQENLALAVKLHAQTEKLCPGLCRPIRFTTQRFNQDLCSGGLLVEVGAAGNTQEEALLAADYLGQAIIALAYGTENRP